jgi:hypothetical protein
MVGENGGLNGVPNTQRASFEMNVKGGLFRVWLVLSAMWLISWIAYVWTSRLDAIDDATGRRFLAFHTDFGRGWTEVQDFGLDAYLRVAAIGAGGPLAALTLGCIVWWIAVGFRHNPN